MGDDVTRKSVDRRPNKKRLAQERWDWEPFCFDSWYGGPIPTVAAYRQTASIGSWYGGPIPAAGTYRQLASMFGGERPDTPAA